MNDNYLEYLTFERGQQLVANVLKENLRQQEGDYFIELENDFHQALMLLQSVLPVIELTDGDTKRWRGEWINSTRKLVYKYRNDYIGN